MSSTSRASTIRLGSYQLHERVGEGGSSQVYRAVSDSGKVVAIKLLAPDIDLDDESARARFNREIRVLAELDHPNVLALLDHGVDPELGPYLVTPLLTGKTLRAVVGGRAICPESALLLVRPALRAVGALHRAGLVHRDLKPEHLVVNPHRHLLVVDLGLAYRPGQTRYTDEGAVVGSVPYMAPEQIEGQAVGPGTDVWAIGVMLYEWIAGRRPFERGRAAEEAAAVLVGAYPPLRSADRRVSDELSALVGSCLAADPAERPTAAELLAATEPMIDWIDLAGETAELATVVDDAFGYQDRVGEFRARRLAREAQAAIESGHMFVALRRVDRGLAYRPDDPGLKELSERAEAAGLVPTEKAPAMRPRARRRWLWALGGIAAVALAVVLAVTLRGNDTSDSRRAPAHRGAIEAAPQDKADSAQMFGRMLNLMERGLELGKKHKDAGGKPSAKETGEALEIFGGMLDLARRAQKAEQNRRDAGTDR